MRQFEATSTINHMNGFIIIKFAHRTRRSSERALADIPIAHIVFLLQYYIIPQSLFVKYDTVYVMEPVEFNLLVVK